MELTVGWVGRWEVKRHVNQMPRTKVRCLESPFLGSSGDSDVVWGTPEAWNKTSRPHTS